MTATIPTDAATHVVCAYRWLHRGDVAMTEAQLRQVGAGELREAYTTLLRLATIVAALICEHDMADVAAAALTPDALPDGVDGFAIHWMQP